MAQGQLESGPASAAPGEQEVANTLSGCTGDAGSGTTLSGAGWGGARGGTPYSGRGITAAGDDATTGGSSMGGRVP
jgi:hypothetical protein